MAVAKLTSIDGRKGQHHDATNNQQRAKPHDRGHGYTPSTAHQRLTDQIDPPLPRSTGAQMSEVRRINVFKLSVSTDLQSMRVRRSKFAGTIAKRAC